MNQQLCERCSKLACTAHEMTMCVDHPAWMVCWLTDSAQGMPALPTISHFSYLAKDALTMLQAAKLLILFMSMVCRRRNHFRSTCE